MKNHLLKLLKTQIKHVKCRNYKDVKYFFNNLTIKISFAHDILNRKVSAQLNTESDHDSLLKHTILMYIQKYEAEAEKRYET